MLCLWDSNFPFPILSERRSGVKEGQSKASLEFLLPDHRGKPLCTQIVALGVTYFIAVSALDVMSNVGTIDDLTSAARIILVLPVATLDAIFILWVFTSMSRTLNQLLARRATAKVGLYR